MRGDHLPYPDDPSDKELPPGPFTRYMDTPELVDPEIGPFLLNAIDDGFDVALITAVRHDEMSPAQQAEIADQVSATLSEEVTEVLPSLVSDATRVFLADVPRRSMHIAMVMSAICGVATALALHWFLPR